MTPTPWRDQIKSRYERRLMEIFPMIEIALTFAIGCYGVLPWR